MHNAGLCSGRLNERARRALPQSPVCSKHRLSRTLSGAGQGATYQILTTSGPTPPVGRTPGRGASHRRD